VKVGSEKHKILPRPRKRYGNWGYVSSYDDMNLLLLVVALKKSEEFLFF